MAYFGGLTTFVRKQYHTYNPDSISLKNIGLASYTRASIQRFGYNYNNNGQLVFDETVREYFGGAVPIGRLLGDTSTYSIEHYDTENERYVTRSGSSVFETPSGLAATSIVAFQTLWDSYQRSEPMSDLQKWRIYTAWANINNSLDGCITFSTPITILGCTEQTKIKLFFTSAGKTSDDRKVALKGSPTIVTVPKDAAFQEYSYYHTMNAPPGQSIGPSEGGLNNPDNTVAAQPLERFDPVTGKIEYGTFQLIARLLDDLDAINMPVLPKNPDEISYDEFKFRNPPIADAIPYMSHNGNPRDFGANSYECLTGNKQKIKVVNLTPRAYKRGEIVLCSLINGMWVPMGYEVPKTLPSRPAIGWSHIQKYIVDHFSFFKSKPNYALLSPTSTLLPNQYLSYMRKKFYLDFKDIATEKDAWILQGNNILKHFILNIDGTPPDAETGYLIAQQNGQIVLPKIFITPITPSDLPNYGYRAVYDTDVLSDAFGGISPKTVLCCTNASASPLVDNKLYSNLTTYSFGAYLIDGYKVGSVYKLKAKNGFQLFNRGAANGIISSGTLNISEHSYFQVNDINIDRIENPIASDSNLKHFPMQLGLHTSGNGILNCQNMIGIMNNFNRNRAISYLHNNDQKFAYLSTIGSDGKYTNAYGLEPVSANKIQFNALGTFSLLSGFETSLKNLNLGNVISEGYNITKLYNHTSSYINPLGIQTGYEDPFAAPIKGQSIFTGINSRVGASGTFELVYNVTSPIPFGESKYFSPGAEKALTYYTAPQSLEGSIGLFPQETSIGGSYVMGIVTMRGTFKGSNGLKFTVNNRWGLNVVKGGTTSSFSFGVSPFIGGGAGLSSLTANTSTSQDTVFYGSQANAIDEFGTLKLVAKVYDHCPNVIYDGRYFAPLFFNPNDESVDFENVYQAPGTIITKGTKIIKKISTIRRNQLLNDKGFLYIKKTVGAYQPSMVFGYYGGGLTPKDDEDELGIGDGYKPGDKIRFGGSSDTAAVFEVIEVGPNGSIILGPAGLKLIQPGNFSESAFEAPLRSTSDGADIIREAVLFLKSGVVTENVLLDPPPILHGEAVLTPDDNSGYGPQNIGWIYNTTEKSIQFSQSDYNKTGTYDVYLFFANDAGIFPENNLNGIDNRIAESLLKYLELDITSV